MKEQNFEDESSWTTVFCCVPLSILVTTHATQGLSRSLPFQAFFPYYVARLVKGTSNISYLSLPFLTRVEALLWTSLAGKAGLNQTFLWYWCCCREKKIIRADFQFFFAFFSLEVFFYYRAIQITRYSFSLRGLTKCHMNCFSFLNTDLKVFLNLKMIERVRLGFRRHFLSNSLA